jgi:hypothetical protein
MAMSTPLHQLGDHGQRTRRGEARPGATRARRRRLRRRDGSVWIDFLSRELLRSGELARMMTRTPSPASPRTRRSSRRRSPSATPTTSSFDAREGRHPEIHGLVRGTTERDRNEAARTHPGLSSRGRQGTWLTNWSQAAFKSTVSSGLENRRSFEATVKHDCATPS